MNIKALYKKNEITYFSNNLKKKVFNEEDDSYALEQISYAPLYYLENNDLVKEKKLGKIQFSSNKIHYNNQYWSVTENISIQFDAKTSLFGMNYYESNEKSGSYPPKSKFQFKILSGTGSFFNKSGYIKINAGTNTRKVSIILDK
jgi:hypothetical protein